ncbi:hypothetical protein L7D48_23565, partial [Streptomyces sp. S1A]|nr:hypothetical protein [Streptomyces sp. ICN903]
PGPGSCHGRPAPLPGRRDSHQWSPPAAPCVRCGRSTNLRDAGGRPAYKVCHGRTVAPGTA